jgi:hypothetical protein
LGSPDGEKTFFDSSGGDPDTLHLRFEGSDLFFGGLRSLDCYLLLLSRELKSLFQSLNLSPQPLCLSLIH